MRTVSHQNSKIDSREQFPLTFRQSLFNWVRTFHLLLNKTFFPKFILRERERESANVCGRGRDTRTEEERISSKPCTVSTEPDAGLEPMNCEITT